MCPPHITLRSLPPGGGEADRSAASALISRFPTESPQDTLHNRRPQWGISVTFLHIGPEV
ncbi:hypothetical protein EYF80_024133 [Liparis tanakae]|uniref:Uncharacterized protein n=1 Tax=Liparis tanakae TaxID=230148 RepID=A0A4Z2HKZ1_9TELE|nr:hypothetical protein EYF80_024133 [Liparis tanakae]